MNASTAAIELSEVAWEQFIGALLRAEHFRRMTATARPRRRRNAPRPRGTAAGRIAAPSLLWMLAASVAGFALLG